MSSAATTDDRQDDCEGKLALLRAVDKSGVIARDKNRYGTIGRKDASSDAG